MNGAGKNNDGILVLGATNLPWALDNAIRRRLEKRIYISLPQKQARTHLLKNSMKNTSHNLVDADFELIGGMTEM
jgi:vacuolar protein-sorting-associated protein 4